MSQQVLSVSQINEYIRRLMDTDSVLGGRLRVRSAIISFIHPVIITLPLKMMAQL